MLTCVLVEHQQDAHTNEWPSESASDDFSGWDWTEEEETRLRHKMDWRTVPWVTVLYLLCVSLFFILSSGDV